MSKPLKQIQSLARGLAILELAARHPQGLRLNDIASALAVEPPSAHILAATLVAGGYLQKTERPVRYFLGAAVLTLAGRYSHRGLLDHAEAVFHDLQISYPTATLTLSQYIAPEITVVLRSNPERPGVIERPQERFMHPYGNATSLVFQAFWDDQQRQAYRHAHPFWESGTHHWASSEALDAALQTVRQTGLCAVNWPGRRLSPFAAGIFDAGGTLAAVLGLSVPDDDLSVKDRRSICEAVLAAARTMSQWNAPVTHARPNKKRERKLPC